MGASSFHRAFKEITGDSPVQYLKKIRLLKAKGLLVFEGKQVNAAAYEVGYASPEAAPATNPWASWRKWAPRCDT